MSDENLPIADRIEPGLRARGDLSINESLSASQAISLKRIADSLAPIAKVLVDVAVASGLPEMVVQKNGEPSPLTQGQATEESDGHRIEWWMQQTQSLLKDLGRMALEKDALARKIERAQAALENGTNGSELMTILKS